MIAAEYPAHLCRSQHGCKRQVTPERTNFVPSALGSVQRREQQRRPFRRGQPRQPSRNRQRRDRRGGRARLHRSSAVQAELRRGRQALAAGRQAGAPRAQKAASPPPVRVCRGAASTTNLCPADWRPRRARSLRPAPRQSATAAHGRRFHRLRCSGGVGRSSRAPHRPERHRLRTAAAFSMLPVAPTPARLLWLALLHPRTSAPWPA